MRPGAGFQGDLGKKEEEDRTDDFLYFLQTPLLLLILTCKFWKDLEEMQDYYLIICIYN